MTRYFILDDYGQPRPATNIEWAEWFEGADRRVARDKVDDGSWDVSTVFLGLDHGLGGKGDQLLIYETMIFCGPHDDYEERYSTREDALAGHARAVSLAKEHSR